MSEIKKFIDPKTNVLLGSGAVADGYIYGGVFNEQRQSSAVPFTYALHAINQEKGISIFILSEEMYFDYRNSMLKMGASMSPGFVKTSLRKYMEPLDYLKESIEPIFGSSIKEVAQATLPSKANLNPEKTFNEYSVYLNRLIYAESVGGQELTFPKAICNSYLVKYEGIKDNKEYTILGGVDFKGAEHLYPSAQMLNNLGGLLGGLFGESKNQSNSTDDRFGYGKCDGVEWGSNNRYVLIVPKENENEGINAFIELVSTFEVNPEIVKYKNELLDKQIQAQISQVQGFQRQTQINIANNQMQQQKLTNMLRENSQSISAGLMDSWNKKMDSQSRMSTNYSEAIRGVNSYVTSDGRTVEHSVSSDHVYENKYGDTIGVSGNALDNDLLSKLNWTEINKK